MTRPTSSGDPLTPQIPSPSSKAVSDFHKYSDVDKSPASQHHTIGRGPNRSASSEHSHNGADSVSLLAGVVFTGSISTNQPLIVKQILTALTALGAQDATIA